MKVLTDEILNKYSDGEISEIELDELNTCISENPDELNKLKAQRMIDDTLQKAPSFKAPVNFTEKVMSVILESGRKAQSSNGFFLTMLSVIGVSITATIAYAIISSLPYSEKSFLSLNRINSILPDLKYDMKSIATAIFSSDLMWIGALLSIILLATSFFVIESHKEFKKNLNSF